MLFSSDAIGTQNLYDPLDIFSDSNGRPLKIQFDFPTSTHDALARAIFQTERTTINTWTANCFRGSSRQAADSFAQHVSGFRDHLGISNQTQQPILDCSQIFGFCESLGRGIYIGPFRNAINQGSANYYDISVGDAFIKTWNSWKSGNLKTQNLAINRVTEDIRHIFELGSLEISASSDNTTLHLSVDGRPYKLNELGAGIAQFIIVLGNVMIVQPQYVFIDEPELNLHPALQIDFLTTIASYAKRGVVFATHSLGLARSVAERIYTFQRKTGVVSVTPFEQTPNYPEFLGEMSFSGFKDLGGDRILLVEGVHDVKTAHQFLRQIRKDHKVVVLPLGGDQLARGGVELELAELKRLSKNIFVLVDSERDAATSPPAPKRLAFERVCRKLGFDICVTERRAIENYLSDRAVKIVKGSKYSGLKPYEKLADSPLGWDKGEGWRIAREMESSELRGTDIGALFGRI
jgi:hypothetical protein